MPCGSGCWCPSVDLEVFLYFSLKWIPMLSLWVKSLLFLLPAFLGLALWVCESYNQTCFIFFIAAWIYLHPSLRQSPCCPFSNALSHCWPWWDRWPGDQAGSAHSRCSPLSASESGKHLRIPEWVREPGEPGKPKICAEEEQRTLPVCLGVQSLSISKPLGRKVGATEIRDRVRSGLSPQFCPASNLHIVWRRSGDQTVCCCELVLSVSAVNLQPFSSLQKAGPLTTLLFTILELTQVLSNCFSLKYGDWHTGFCFLCCPTTQEQAPSHQLSLGTRLKACKHCGLLVWPGLSVYFY